MKPGVRMLGVAESFHKGVSKRSVLAGVVMRRDLMIDGFSFSFPTVGGMDATEKVIELYGELRRRDINYICISGCVVSWFNVINLSEVFKATNVPVISITYEDSPGLEKYFKQYFPEDWEARLRVYVGNGGRVRVKLKTGCEVFVRAVGLDVDEAKLVLNGFTMHGKYPEPVRVARILAHSMSKKMLLEKMI